MSAAASSTPPEGALAHIVIADDHVLVRDAIVTHLEASGSVRVVARAADGDAALALIRRHRPDVAVLDLAMPKRNGLRVARALHEDALGVPIVLLTMAAEDEVAREARRYGVRSLVLKHEPPSVLLRAIAAAHAGIEGEGHWGRANAPQRDSLTPREREVVTLAARGLSSRQIGDALGIRPRTVETHRANAMGKIGAHATADLVRFAIRAGLVEP